MHKIHRKFLFIRQLDQKDCGPTCLQMVAKYHGRYYSLAKVREHSHSYDEAFNAVSVQKNKPEWSSYFLTIP